MTATSLVDDGLVQDVYLTTTSRAGGAPGTPWYGGTHSLALTVTTRKEWMDEGSRLIFEHILIGESVVAYLRRHRMLGHQCFQT